MRSVGSSPNTTATTRCPKVLLASMSGSHGGMEVRMQQDAELLRAHGWRPMVTTPHFPERPAWQRQLQQSDIPMLPLPYPYLLEHWQTRRLQKLKAQLLTGPALRLQRFDLAHMFLCWTTYGLGMLWAIARAGIPAMVSVHNAFPMTEFAPWHRAHLTDAFATTRRVVAVSSSALEHFLDIFADYLPDTVITQVIPNPVDTERFRPRPALRATARQRLGVPLDAMVIGSVGRLDKQKQPWKLLQTVAELHALGMPAHLVLVGQGRLEGSLREQSDELGLSDHVVFTGYVRDVEALFPAFDLHLLLSRNEGFGIVTAEAMAAGVPALGSDVPGTRDVLAGTKGGLLLKSGDPPQIAREVALLLANAESRHAMAAVAPGEIRSRFGREQVETQVFAAYSAVLGETGAPC